jgi:hypothetical protein
MAGQLMGLAWRHHTGKFTALVACTSAALLQSAALRAQQWEVVQPQTSRPSNQRFEPVPRSSQPAGSLQWSVRPSAQTATTESSPVQQQESVESSIAASSEHLIWQPLTAAEVEQQQQAIDAEIQQAQELINNPTIVFPPSGPTYANFRALWRDGDWLPQISNTVPVGFGPQGLMATLEYRAIDCITGAGYCTVPTSYQDWTNTISRSGDAFFDTSIGFGDSLKAIGVVFTAVSENTNTNLAGRSGQGETIFGNINLGIHLAKSFGPDTSLRFGVENLVREDCYGGACGLPQNAYGVLSQRIRLHNDQRSWFPNAYLTVGTGNGSYRPLSEQVQASIAAQRAAGCSTYGYSPEKDCSDKTRRQAVYNAASFGDLTPIGSVGLEVFRGFHLISEWSGRNLNAGLSFRPFEGLGLVITPMWENLLPNCDYGCRVNVPDYPPGAPIPSNLLTDRARFSIQASIEVKF